MVSNYQITLLKNKLNNPLTIKLYIETIQAEDMYFLLNLFFLI
jgi:hypothetical protein